MADRASVERVQKMSVAERKEEEARQTQVLAEVIDAAIHLASEKFDVPIMNAVAGALVTVEASMLASLSTDHRKMLRKSMDKARPQALALALTRNPAQAKVMLVRSHDA